MEDLVECKLLKCQSPVKPQLEKYDSAEDIEHIREKIYELINNSGLEARIYM